MKRINFYNTYEISVPIWNWLFPFLKKNQVEPCAILSLGKYRKEKKSRIGSFVKTVFVPRFLMHSKKWNHVLYILLSPYYILFNKPDLNIFYTQPPFALPFLAFFSRVSRVPYCVHIMDYHPDLIQSFGYLKKKSWLYKNLDLWNINALKKSEKIIVLGECMNQLFLAKGISNTKIDIIPNISSIESFDLLQYSKVNVFKEKYKVHNKYMILYAGNMGVAHEFRTILEVSRQFEDSIHFFFVGKGARQKQVKQYIVDNECANITLLSYLSDDEFQLLLQVTDMHYISLKNGFEGIMVPSKFYSSLAIGKPILFEGSRESEVSRIIEKYNCGFVIPHCNKFVMHTYLKRLTENDLNLRKLALNAKTCYKSNFHSTIFCKKYLQTIKECF